MKIYDFDKETDRRGSGAFKTDALKKIYGREDLIPLWVADMDFEILKYSPMWEVLPVMMNQRYLKRLQNS